MRCWIRMLHKWFQCKFSYFCISDIAIYLIYIDLMQKCCPLINEDVDVKMILRCCQNRAPFTVTFLPMLVGSNGKRGLSGSWELMVRWLGSCNPEHLVHNGAQSRVTVSHSQTRHFTLSMPLSSQECSYTAMHF